ncbi:jg3072 [Pararge aegeria aegeria]|uniref:Jg3072 protein n=1 Tax=Pararge aegeria aegeria TaxID=348720 RepID=A0A8S4QGH1_9NEOP|nr:jg3072 [Pararge aegeria aegeria]
MTWGRSDDGAGRWPWESVGYKYDALLSLWSELGWLAIIQRGAASVDTDSGTTDSFRPTKCGKGPGTGEEEVVEEVVEVFQN